MPNTNVNAPFGLRCEYQENPLGMGEDRPRLSWQLGDERSKACQTAYQVLVENEAGAPVWDSGKILSDASIQIPFEGPALVSRARYSWRVRTWDSDDVQSPWSNRASWEMGLLEPGDWRGVWIGQPSDQIRELEGHDAISAAPFLRRPFALTAPPKRARLYVTARGLYEAYLNGRRVGDHHLAPGWTDFRYRVRYQTFDVTDLLRERDNVVGAILAPGWYSGHVCVWNKIYGALPWFLCQLEIETQNDEKVIIASDGAWKTSTGPILGADLLRGETHDARLEMPGWHEVKFDDGPWEAVAVEALGEFPALEAPTSVPVRKMMELEAKEISEPAHQGAFVFDLGQNMVGHVRLTARAAAGQVVTLRFAEMLNPDGTIYVENLGTATSMDRYTFRGDAQGESWEPRFTFHGFRYVEVTGLEGTPEPSWITGIVVHSDMPLVGSFECSNDLINRLQQNIVWGQRGNYLEVPTDCPQRDERLGWLGDAQVFVRTGCFNFDTAAFLSKWMMDVVDSQRTDDCFTDYAPYLADMGSVELEGKRGSPGWADAALIVPWTMYERYGDVRILEKHYESMVRYIDFLDAEAPEGIGPDFGYGDWLNDAAFTPMDLISTAFNAHSADLMSRIAAVLDRDQDTARFRRLFEKFRSAFQQRFLTPEGRLVGDTQTAYVLALQFDLLPASIRHAAAERLVYDVLEGRRSEWAYAKRNGRLSCGFLGASHICDVLAESGHLDMAYKLLLNEQCPSWLFPVKQGATTIWERWDGWTPQRGFQDSDMNSFNHYAYGAIGEWLYETVAGIRPAVPGYKRIAIRPRPGGGLQWVKCAYESPHGRIESHWRHQGAHFNLEVQIPPNTLATVTMPNGAIHEVEAGRHTFTAELSPR